MTRNYALLLLALLCLNLKAQQSVPEKVTPLDTVCLKEVTVSCVIPLNNKQVENFYKTNYFSTIDNLTAHLDGVSLIKRGSYAMEPQLNGFSGGQLNVTISGMKMFGACTDKMDPVTSYIEPTNLRSIALEHGTNGGLYGNNIGGSMDMALQEPDTKSLHPYYADVSFGYESVSNSRNALLSTGYTNKKWQWGLNAVYRKNDSYKDGLGNTVKFSQFEKYNIHSVLKYLPDSINTLKADVLYDLGTNIGYPALPMDVSKARASIFGVEYQRVKANYKLQAKIYYNSVYHVMDDSHRDSLFFVRNKISGKQDSVIMRMDMPGRSNTFGSFVLATYRLNAKNRLTIKADNYINSSLAEMTMYMHFVGETPAAPMYLQTWPDIVRNVTGLYIQNTTFVSDKLFLTVNGRVDYALDHLQSEVASQQFSVFNYNLPRTFNKFTKSVNLSAQYQLATPLQFTFQTGFSERIPTITEQYGYYLFNAYDGYDYIGNPYLKTEKSLSGRAALTYTNTKLKINLSQSCNFLTDYIMGITNTDIPPMNFYTNGLRVYQNVQGATLLSTDLQAIYNPVEGLYFFALTKYTWGRLNSGDPIPLIPPLKNTLSASYEKNCWSVQLDNETSLEQQRINVQYGETKSPSFSIFNIKGSYHLMFSDVMMDCSAGVTNLLNTAYYEHLDWGHLLRPGRSLNLFVKISY
jgi:iron complex outermembrane receptor protein